MRAAAMLLIALVGAVAASGCEDKRPNKCKPNKLHKCDKSKNFKKKCALSCGVCSVGAAAAAAACADKASEKKCERFAMKNKCSKSKHLGEQHMAIHSTAAFAGVNEIL